MRKIMIFIFFLIFVLNLSGCVDYGYSFHYDVVGGNGTIEVNDDVSHNRIHLCQETGMCELGCTNSSRVIMFLGGRRGSVKLTFIAIPDDGYRVKEWRFNGQIIVGNNSNLYTATVSNTDNYNGVISVEFERINTNT